MSKNDQKSSKPKARPVTPGRWLNFVALNATVFIASACVMVVEILSTRLVAPFLGSSLYTWTSAIGVVLAGISMGSYFGGRLADLYTPRRTLAVLFVLASVTCMTIPLMNNLIGVWSALDGLQWPTRIFLHFTLAFLLPATMLGTMSPVVAKLALSEGHGTGRTIGTIYAWSTVGSIVGTFVAGFFLVAWMGSEGAILLVSGVLALMGIAYGYKTWYPYPWTASYALIIVAALSPWPGADAMGRLLGIRDRDTDSIIFKKDSHYQRVIVRTTGSSLQRTMVLDSLIHSKVDLEDPLDLKYEYETIYAEVLKKCRPEGKPISVFFIGGGGFIFPRYVEIQYPGSYLEVTEIDPVVTEAAYEAFGLPRQSSIRAFNMDARNRVSDLIRMKRAGETVPKFDFVFGDAFNDFSVPYHLTTLEFNQLLAELMTDDGVYMLNLIDRYDSGQFLGTVIRTCKEVFPHVSAFAATDSAGRNTFVLVASRKPLELGDVAEAIRSRRDFSGDLLKPEHLAHVDQASEGLLLTDDYAPVENLLAEVVRSYKRESGAKEAHSDEIATLVRQGKFNDVIELCREALARNPRAPRMHYRIGSALALQGQFEAAIGEYRQELAISPADKKSHVMIARAYNSLGNLPAAVKSYREALKIDPSDGAARCSLGQVLARSGEKSAAAGEYLEVLKRNPGYVRAHVLLGNLYFDVLDFAKAIESFRTALHLNPEYPQLRHDLGLALLRAGKPGEAIVQFESALKGEPENAVLHNQLGRALGQPQVQRFEEALASFQKAVDLNPGNAMYRANLGLAFQDLGRDAESVEQYRECLRIESSNLPVVNTLARLLSTSPDVAARNGTEALQWAQQLCDAVPDNAEALDTLASAQAEVGQFEDAVSTATRALQLARVSGPPALVSGLEARLGLYRSGQPYRAPTK